MTITKKRSATKRRVSEQDIYDRDGRLHFDEGFALYKHGRSKFIYADYRPSADRRESTRTATVEQAKVVARRRLRELSHRVSTGLPIATRGPSVADLLHAYLKTLKTSLAGGDGTVKPEISAIESSFIPFWKDIPLGRINRQSFYAWEEWRKTGTDKQGSSAYRRGDHLVTMNRKPKFPAPATLAREKNYFVRALAWGSDQQAAWVVDETVHEIRYLPRRKKHTVKHARATEQRDAFEREEVGQLMHEFEQIEQRERDRARLKGEVGLRKNYQRRLMALHVRLLLASGLRPGKEILELTWGRVKPFTTDGGVGIIVIDRCGNGKTGPRMVNCDPITVAVIDDLKRLHREFGFEITPDATLWPSTRGENSVVQDFRKSFKTVVNKLKLRKVVQDEPLYICRHTYITEHLRRGISSDVISTNCGTSVEMIERHYKHLKAEQIRDQLLPPVEPGQIRLAKPIHTQALLVGRDGSLTLGSGASHKTPVTETV